MLAGEAIREERKKEMLRNQRSLGALIAVSILAMAAVLALGPASSMWESMLDPDGAHIARGTILDPNGLERVQSQVAIGTMLDPDGMQVAHGSLLDPDGHRLA